MLEFDISFYVIVVMDESSLVVGFKPMDLSEGY